MCPFVARGVSEVVATLLNTEAPGADKLCTRYPPWVGVLRKDVSGEETNGLSAFWTVRKSDPEVVQHRLAGFRSVQLVDCATTLFLNVLVGTSESGNIPRLEFLTLDEGGDRVDIEPDDGSSGLCRFDERGTRSCEGVEDRQTIKPERSFYRLNGTGPVVGYCACQDSPKYRAKPLCPPFVRVSRWPVNLLAP